jgi:hypothetical protein
MAIVTSPNMNLPVPVVGSEPGPDWANQINNCMSIIDTHNHSAGYGIPINPSGLDINSDLTFNINNATQLRSVRLYANPSLLSDPTDVSCLYGSGVDLYFNDGSGNQVRITQSGGVAGSPGSIGSLASPASATYVSASEKFVWQSDANVAASLDARDIILRNSSASSNGMTLSPPAAMGSDFTVTFPALPASIKFLSLDNTGNMGASIYVDASTLEVSSNVLQIKDSGVVTAKIADANVTRAKLEAVGQQTSSNSGTFTTTSTSYVDVTNLSVTITTTGRLVFIGMISDTTESSGTGIVKVFDTASLAGGVVSIVRGSTGIAFYNMYTRATGATYVESNTPCGGICTFNAPAAGTYTYKISIKADSGSSIQVQNCRLIAYEL